MLSAAGMRRVSQKDLGTRKFIVGDHEHECGIVQACFISPEVYDDEEGRTQDYGDTHDLNGPSLTRTCECRNPRSETFRCLRLRQTGKDGCGSHSLQLSQADLVGSFHPRLS